MSAWYLPDIKISDFYQDTIVTTRSISQYLQLYFFNISYEITVIDEQIFIERFRNAFSSYNIINGQSLQVTNI